MFVEKSGSTIDNIGLLHDRHSLFSIDSPSSIFRFTFLPRLNGTASEQRQQDPDEQKSQVYQCADPRGNLECETGTRIKALYTIRIYIDYMISYTVPELEILAGIKCGGWALKYDCINIGSFKYGGSVRDPHMYNKYEMLADFLIWRSQRFNSLPNFRQFRCRITNQTLLKKSVPDRMLIILMVSTNFNSSTFSKATKLMNQEFTKRYNSMMPKDILLWIRGVIHGTTSAIDSYIHGGTDSN